MERGAPVSASPPRIARVGEVLARIRGAIRDALPPLWIAGEVSNLRRASSGHIYFTLKDPDGQLRCALFRRDAARVPFALEDGLEVIAFGEVGVYEARGDLQLIVRQMEPRGQGALQLAFDQLRKRLDAEGLFAEERKREIPRFPSTVGIVTSASGAALQDILRILRERGPALRLVVAAARVQGAAADLEIISAMQKLVAHGAAEMIVLARGGGSLEDLWCFNSESLARAIVRTPVPVVTGIGHETDLTIADLCADRSAPTPTAAAVEVIPSRESWRGRVDQLGRRSFRGIAAKLAWRRDQVGSLRRALRGHSPKAQLDTRRVRFSALGRALGVAVRFALSESATKLDRQSARLVAVPLATGFEGQRARVATHASRLDAAFEGRLRGAREALALSMARLDTLSPLSVLGRGYAIVRRARDGRILRTPGETRTGEWLRVRLGGGELSARVADPPDED